MTDPHDTADGFRAAMSRLAAGVVMVTCGGRRRAGAHRLLFDPPVPRTFSRGLPLGL
jgi:hypothetical protein